MKHTFQTVATRLLMAGLFAVAPLTSADEPARIVFMIGEDEYQTWETLPKFAKKDLLERGYRVTIVAADEADKNNFPGLVAALRDADLLFLSVRRRTPLKEQLNAVRAHLAAGKPLIGIRTASHAFALRPKDRLDDPKLATWQEFDPQVLGGHYSGHYGNGPTTAVTIAPGSDKHPILRDVSVANLVGNGSLYRVNPLEPKAVPLLMGDIPGQAAEPVAWTNLFGEKQTRVFYTSLGHPEDFKNAEFRRLLVNSVQWALGK